MEVKSKVNEFDRVDRDWVRGQQTTEVTPGENTSV
jgi:hypothetical protein